MIQPEVSDAETTVQQLLSEFDRMSGGLGTYTKSRQAWDAAASFLRWCKQHSVKHPLLFMWLRFRILKAAKGARVRPGLKSLASEGLLQRYESVASRAEHEAELKKRFATQRERELISNSAGNEAVRRDYQLSGRSDMCEAQLGLSGGYHPYSAWCPACPRALTCAQRLNVREGFDVVALRLGRLTPEQAVEQKRRA